MARQKLLFGFLAVLGLSTLVFVPVGTAQAAGPNLATYISDSGGMVYQSWAIARSIINVLLVIGLLIIAFANITRFNLDNYTVKKALPNLVIGVILANTSFLIIRFLVDICTATVFFFVNLAHAGTFGDLVKTSMTNITISTIQETKVAALLLILFVIVSFIMMCWLAFLLYFRLVAIYLLTILSPLAFLCYGIPGLDRFFKQWWQQFVKWLFMIVVMAAIFWLMNAIIGTGQDSIAKLMIAYVLFFLALTTPTRMGGAVMNKASAAFMKYTGANAARKWGEDQAKNAGRWAVSRTPGVYRLQEWSKLRRENFEKGLANRRALAAVKAGGGRAGMDRARLGLESQIINNKKSASDTDIERQAFLGGDISKRLSVSDYKKRLADALKTGTIDHRKLELLFEDLEVKKMFTDFSKEAAHQAAITDALGKEEMYKQGDFNRDRLHAIKPAATVIDLKKADAAEKARLDAAIGTPEYAGLLFDYTTKKTERDAAIKGAADDFEEAKKTNPDLAQYKDLDALVLAMDKDKGTTEGKIIAAEVKRASSSLNATIEAKSKDDIEQKSVSQVMADIEALFDGKTDEIKQALASGNTLGKGIDSKTMGDFTQYAHTLRSMTKDERDFRFNDGLKEALNMVVKVGKQQLKYYDKNAKGYVTIDAADLAAGKFDVEKMTTDQKRAIRSQVFQSATFAGTPASRFQSMDMRR